MEPGSADPALDAFAAQLFDKYAAPMPFKVVIEGMAKEAGADRQLAILFEVARRALRLKRWQHAVAAYTAALSQAKKEGDTLGILESNGSLGQAVEALGNSVLATQHYEQTLAVAKTAGHVPSQVQCYRDLSRMYRGAGALEKAVECGKRLLELLSEASDDSAREEVVGIENQTGADLWRLGRMKEAEQHLQTALTLWEPRHGTQLKFSCLNNLGRVYLTTDRFQQVDETSLAGLQLAEETRDADAQSFFRNLLGSSCIQTGRLKEAVEHFEKCLSLTTTGTTVSRSDVLSNLGFTLRELGDFSNAVARYTEGLALAREDKNDATASKCLNGLGCVAMTRGDCKLAARYLLEALELKLKTNEQPGLAALYVVIGDVYFKLGNVEEAAKAFQSGLSAAEKVNEQVTWAVCKRNLATCARDAGKPEHALSLYHEALDVLKRVGNNYLIVDCLEAIGATHRRIGDAGQAMEYLRRAADLRGSVRADAIPQQYRMRYWRSGVRTFNALVSDMVTSRWRDIASALEYSEKGRGRALEEYLRPRVTSATIPGLSSVNFRRIRDLSARIGRAILEFRVTNDATYAFLVTPDSTEPALAVIKESLSSLFKLLIDKREDGSFTGLQADYGRYSRGEALEEDWLRSLDCTLKALWERLMHKVTEELPVGKRVVIIPSSVISVLPVHACSWIEGGRRVCPWDDIEVTYAPNCSILESCYERAGVVTDQSSYLGIGHPALLFAPWELEATRRWFHRTDMFSANCTKQTLLRDAGDFDVIHLATHGKFELGDEMESELALADGSLKLKEVFSSLRLTRSKLVTLSACETGLTSFADVAEESFGLHTGFLCAGVPTVIASLWRVNDFSTATLMSKMYELMVKERQGKAEALRNAQRWLRKRTAQECLSDMRAARDALVAASGSRVPEGFLERLDKKIDCLERRAPTDQVYEHPRYWAGFQCFGAAE